MNEREEKFRNDLAKFMDEVGAERAQRLLKQGLTVEEARAKFRREADARYQALFRPGFGSR